MTEAGDREDVPVDGATDEAAVRAEPDAFPGAVVRVTATLTRAQATAVLRSVPWVRRAVVHWLVGTALTSAVGVPLVVAVTGEPLLGALVVVLLAAALADAFGRAPWSRPVRRPDAHGVGSPVVWTFSPAGLAVEAVTGHGFRPWSAVDDVVRRGDLLVVRQRARRWATGVPLEVLPPGAVEQVTAWHATAPPSPPPVEVVPGARRDGADLVVVGDLSPPAAAARVREPLVGWTRGLLRAPVRLLLLAAPVVSVVLAAVSGDPVRVAAAWLSMAGLLVVVAALEAVVRAAAVREGGRGHAWRLGQHALGIAVDGCWMHVPWQRVARVTATPAFLVAACQDFDASVVVPVGDAPAGAVDDVLGWVRAAGVPVADRRGGPVTHAG